MISLRIPAPGSPAIASVYARRWVADERAMVTVGRVLAAGGSSRWSSALANEAEALEEVHGILTFAGRAVPG